MKLWGVDTPPHTRMVYVRALCGFCLVSVQLQRRQCFRMTSPGTAYIRHVHLCLREGALSVVMPLAYLALTKCASKLFTYIHTNTFKGTRSSRRTRTCYSTSHLMAVCRNAGQQKCAQHLLLQKILPGKCKINSHRYHACWSHLPPSPRIQC